VAALSSLLTRLGLRSIAGSTTAVVDFDSTALVCFGTQEGAEFGYCGKGRNRRRHHPLVASVGETRAVVHAAYRDGSAIDENESIAFMKETIRRVSVALSGTLTLRADSGFWSKAMGVWLVSESLPFAFSMPLYASLKLLLMGVKFTAVSDDEDEDVEAASLPGTTMGYDASVRIVVVRRHVHDASAPPSGKRVDWDPAWRYQAVVTNMEGEPVDLWRFYNGRGDAERVFKVGKQALGLGRLVGHDFRANTVAFFLRLIAYVADILFQQDAERRATAERRAVKHVGLQVRQRYFYQLAGRLLRAQNRWVLRVPANAKVAAMWNFYDRPWTG
jgi:hypothetical protein